MNEISPRSDNSNNCVLCIKSTPKTIQIFGTQGRALKIAQILCQHFWFTFNETDESQKICVPCWEKIDLFHQFYESVREAHFHQNEIRPFSESKDDDSVSVPDCQFDNYDTDDATNSDKEDEPYPSNELSQQPCTTVNANEDAKRIGPPLDSTMEMDAEPLDPTTDANEGATETRQKLKKSTKDRNTRQKTSLPLDPTIDADEEVTTTRDKLKKSTKDGNTLDAEQRIAEYFRMNCDLCGEQLSSLNNVSAHFRKKHRLERGYLICCCSKKAKVRKAVIEHVQWHMNPNMFRCDECSRIFNEKRALRIHKAAHQMQVRGLLECNLCTKQFSNQSVLTQHVARVHPSDNQKFSCDICQKDFKLKIILEAHIKYKHSGTTQQHICDICAKVLSTKQNLKEHTNTHFDIPRVQCNICGALLKNRICLATHMKSHTDTKQTCDICFQVKANRTSLLNHKRRVHGPPNHKCILCEKSFTRSSALREHVATHTGENLYTCNYCPQTFKSNSNMYKHMKQVHPQYKSSRKK